MPSMIHQKDRMLDVHCVDVCVCVPLLVTDDIPWLTTTSLWSRAGIWTNWMDLLKQNSQCWKYSSTLLYFMCNNLWYVFAC